MRIDNKKIVEKFFIVSASLWVAYLILLIYNIVNGISAAGVLLQIIILSVITGLLVFLYWLWKEAQY